MAMAKKMLYSWYSTAANDFRQTSVSVTFGPSETNHNVSVTVVNDGTLESTETFTAVLTAIPGSVIGAADTATAIITDDDSKPNCYPEFWCDLL